MTAFEPAQIDRIMEILGRTRTGRQVDREMAQEALLEVIQAVGLASDGTQESQIWHEFSIQETDFHKTGRDGFRELAEADDPFELARRDQNLADLLNRSTALRHLTRQRQETSNSQAPIWRSFWGTLSAQEQSTVRKSLKASACYHATQIRRGRVQKTEFDTALLELADLFLTWTGQTIARHRVPYAVESQFIQFAVAALEPVGQYFEVSAFALSRRWERIVKEARKSERALNEPLPDPDIEGR
jgi:hypothetical protein